MSLRTAMPSAAKGFTLVEVLVALGIVAVALAAGVRSSAALTRNAERQSDLLLAQLCAENALVAVRLSKQMPAVGDNNSTRGRSRTQFGRYALVRPTPNPNFLRVQAHVAQNDEPLLALSTVVGRY